MNVFSQATDEIALLITEDSSTSLVISPTSHSNLGRFFNSPSNNTKGSLVPSKENMELFRFCIERQVKLLFKSIRFIKK